MKNSNLYTKSHFTWRIAKKQKSAILETKGSDN